MNTGEELAMRMDVAQHRYGSFASTHEALGVLDEEYTELRGAIHANDLAQVQHEALDIAAAAIRLAEGLEDSQSFMARRSVK